MSRNLKMATVAAMLAFAATGVAQARGANFDRGGFSATRGYPGYAAPVTPFVRSWGFVPGRGIVGESCDLPTSACSNGGRPNWSARSCKLRQKRRSHTRGNQIRYASPECSPDIRVTHELKVGDLPAAGLLLDDRRDI
jgi:hypothetical protein